MKLIFSLAICLTFTWNIIFAQNVVINELMSDNEAAVTDEAGDFDDWIELYNNTDTPIDISGYGLSDDVDELGKFSIPENTIIAGNGYLIIWADDDQEQGPLHAQFKLSSSGEGLFLTDRNINLVDQIDFPELEEDQAFARDPNGTGDFLIKAHSFNGDNDLAVSTLAPIPASISFSPNPAKDFLNIQSVNKSELKRIALYDMNGQLILEQFSFGQDLSIDLSDLPSGNILLKIDDYQAVLIQKIN